MTRWQKAVLTSILVTALCLSAVAWMSSRQRAFRFEELRRDAQVVAHQFASRVEGGMKQHLIALVQMANFFENSVEITDQEFYDFAAVTRSLGPACLRISALDSSLHVQRVYPPKENAFLVGVDARTHALGYETVKRAMEAREPAFSSALALLDGPQGFILAVPIYRQGRFIGEVVSSFRADDFSKSMLLPEVLERYDQRILLAGTPVFESPAFSGAEGPVAAETFTFGGKVWEVHVGPRAAVARQSLGAGQGVLWALGGLLALGIAALAGAGTYWASAIVARLQSQGTALREAQERLDGAMEQLLQAEKLAALGEIVSGVAHEINNPLATIMGYTELFLMRELPPDFRRRLETLHSEAERISKIVNNLLTFARKQPPMKRHVELNGILEKTLELKAYHFKVSQIEVEKDLDPIPRTMADPFQLQQVLLHLLNNAEQATAGTGRRGRIRVTTRPRGGWIEVRVSDNGPGISPAIRSRIFEPFFTTKQEERGTGLGLALCYGIVQEHGGRISVEDQAGEGATFLMELPVVSETPVAAEAPVTPSLEAASLRVLVIDDEPSVQNFLVELLTWMGCRVDVASDVPEGLRKIAGNGHDLIISDMKMPHGTGRDIYRAVIEKNPRLARRIVFTTGDGASPETKRFLEETGNEIVPKPFTIDRFRQAIARAAKN